MKEKEMYVAPAMKMRELLAEDVICASSKSKAVVTDPFTDDTELEW